MSATSAIRIVDTTLRDGSHAIAHQYRVEQVRTVASALDRAGVWAIAVGHGDGLGASSIQYGRPLHSDAELLAAAASVVERAQIAIAMLPGIGTKRDLESARDAGATVARVSTVCTEADIGLQHLGLARELGMIAHRHLNTAHLLDPAGMAEAGPGGRRRGEHGRLHRRLGRAPSCPTTSAAGSPPCARRCQTRSPSACTSTTTCRSPSPTRPPRSRRARRWSTPRSRVSARAPATRQTEALVAVLERMGIATGIDLWALQDVADEVVRGEIMQRPIVIDRLTATMGYAAVPASYLLHAIRAGDRFGLDPREIIVELGKRKVVVGQEDAIIGIAAEMAAGRTR